VDSPLTRRVTERIAAMARCYRDSADLYKPIQTQGSSGETIEDFSSPTETNIPGALQSSWGYERTFQQRPVEEATHIFICSPPNNKVSGGDRLLIDSVWYEVKVVDAITGKGVYVEIQLAETV